jgi:Apea-like HEPN
MTSHFYPSLVVFLEGSRAKMDVLELHANVVARNPFLDEIESLNSMTKEWIASQALKKLLPDTIAIECKYLPPTQTDGMKWHDEFYKKALSTRNDVLTLLRLAHHGAITARLVVMPGANVPDCGYTMANVSYLPALYHPEYAKHYPPIDARVRKIFGAHWGKQLQKQPGVRWLNKAADEFYEEDRLVHIVVGLEQLLLRDESERSYLSYKMALRGAWLQGADASDRNLLFQRFRDAYKLRSKIAHGSFMGDLSGPERRLLVDIENELRHLILRWLESPNAFTADALNANVLGSAS